MARRIREEYIEDDPVVVERPVGRRVVTERHVGGFGYGMNPLVWVLAAALVVFILLLLFGGLR